MTATANQNSEPTAPVLWRGTVVCAVLAFLVFFFAYRFLGFPLVMAFVLSAPFLVAWFLAVRSLDRRHAEYEIDRLRYRIGAAERSIVDQQKSLDAGKPWYDDEPIDEWIFNARYQMRRTAEVMEDMKIELESKLRK